MKKPTGRRIRFSSISVCRCGATVCLAMAISLGIAALIAIDFHLQIVVSELGRSGARKDDKLSTITTPLALQCPKSPLSAFNFDKDGAVHYLDSSNVPDLEGFRNRSFDGWGLTFEEVKESRLPFKRQAFLPYLKSGDRIYESACGLGINLYMTLEILQEEAGISNLTVYGNEYLEANVPKAINFLEHLFDRQPGVVLKNRVGTICKGDSADLRFVPSSSFDLVYTGYISPLWDPLELNTTDEAHTRIVQTICEKAKVGDARALNLFQEMQTRQEQWFSNWYKQMIRIAKPGAPVIIEEVAPPICEKMNDWGGVSKDFWRTGVERFGWDVDPSSLMFGSRSPKYDNRRYHVFMRKNGVR